MVELTVMKDDVPPEVPAEIPPSPMTPTAVDFENRPSVVELESVAAEGIVSIQPGPPKSLDAEEPSRDAEEPLPEAPLRHAEAELLPDAEEPLRDGDASHPLRDAEDRLPDSEDPVPPDASQLA